MFQPSSRQPSATSARSAIPTRNWQIALFAFNNTATNLALILMGYYAFFTQNVLGLTAIIVGAIAALMRVWDGVMNPIVRFWLDQTNGRFGRFRPFMLVGNLVMISTMVAIFHVPDSLGPVSQYAITAALYLVHIIGYTMQTVCTKGAQRALTQDAKQRTAFSWFDAIYNLIVFNGSIFLVTWVLAPRYQRQIIDPQLFQDVSWLFAALSFLLTILAVIGIWQKDRTEFYSLGESSVKVSLQVYLDVLKNNKPLQRLIAAAATGKLAGLAVPGGLIYLFSNLLLDVSLYGPYALLTMIPGFLITLAGLAWARKVGNKKAYLWVAGGSAVLLLALLVLAPPVLGQGTTITAGVIGLLVLLALQQSLGNITGQMVLPMIEDCADHETHRTGRFIPGLVSTLYFFMDKLITALAPLLIGIAITWAGLGQTRIAPDQPANSRFVIAVLVIVLGLPLLSQLTALAVMPGYELGNERLAKIRRELQLRRQNRTGA